MHSLLTPYVRVLTSPISPQVICSSNSSVVPLHASVNAVHFEYDHKPSFQEGQRLSTQPVDTRHSVQKHTDYDALSFDNTTAAAADDDGVCMHSNVLTNFHSEQLSREGTQHNPLEQLSVKGIGRTPPTRYLHLPMLSTKDARHAKLSQQSRADSEMFSFEDMSDVDFDDEDEEEDARVNDCDFTPLSTQSTVKGIGRTPRRMHTRHLHLPMPPTTDAWHAKLSRQSRADSDMFSFEDMSDVDFDDEDEEKDARVNDCGFTPLSTQSTVKGIRQTPRRMHRGHLHLPLPPTTDVRHAKFSRLSRVDSDMFSFEDMSNVDFDEDEADKQRDTRVNDTPLSTSSSKAFNPLDFARVYNLVALRVSLAECASLAYRLKGHLLNWPRINNIARIGGDDMDWDTKSLLSDGRVGRVEGIEDSLLRAVYGTATPPGHLGRLIKRLNSAEKLSSRRFRFLKSLSHPGYKAMKGMQEKKEVLSTKRKRKNHYVVELGDCEDQRLSLDTSLPSLGFSMKKWMGPSRLLLLDKKYAGQPISKLPMAVQILLNECVGNQKRGPRREIVPCKLTLFYEYWSMEEIINHLLPHGEMPLPIKFMGHIAVLSLGEQYSFLKHLIGKVILNKHRPKVKTVINKLEPVEGHFHPALEVLAGNHSVVTTIIENEIPFLVNLATVYWDSELAPERQRLIQRFSKKDVVCDVFAGAGSLALTSAQKVWRVFANDANPEALKYLAKNVAQNQLQAKIELYSLDCRMFIRKLLAFKRPVLMTQIVFSLPTSVETIIDAFKGAFNRETWPASQPLPMLHVYGYCDALRPETDLSHFIACRLGLGAEAVEVHRVKPVESERWLMCASFQLPEALAFDE